MIKNKLTYFLIIALLFSCSTEKKEPEAIVARVGNKVITATEFENSYQSGPSLLKKVGNAKESYLDAMINETLLSFLPEVEKNKTSSSLKKSLDLLRQELLVEKVFYMDVDKKIEVSEDEIKEELLNDAIRIKSKYFVTSSKDLALKFKSELDHGASLDSLYKGIPGTFYAKNDLVETEYMNFSDIPLPFNEILKSLEIGQYSDISEIENNFYIVQNVDIQRDIVSENDIRTKHKHYKKIISYRKMLEESKSYVKKVLDKENIVVNGEEFKNLVEALYPIYNPQEGGLEKNLLPNGIFSEITLKNLTDNLGDRLNNVAVDFKGGSWSNKELLQYLAIRPLDLRATDKADFAGKLRASLAIVLRDWFMEQEGLERAYDKDPEIMAEMTIWENKLAVQTYLDELKADMDISDQDVNKYFYSVYKDSSLYEQLKEKLRAHLILANTHRVLSDKIDSLKLKHPITVYESVLDSVDVDVPKVKPLPDVKIFKLGLPYFRAAFPAPDILWGIQ